MKRAIHPRNIRIFVNVTAELKERLDAMSERRKWSLSKTGYMALVRGLEVLEQEDEPKTNSAQAD